VHTIYNLHNEISSKLLLLVSIYKAFYKYFLALHPACVVLHYRPIIIEIPEKGLAKSETSVILVRYDGTLLDRSVTPPAGKEARNKTAAPFRQVFGDSSLQLLCQV
jgi:hypothetical protein